MSDISVDFVQTTITASLVTPTVTAPAWADITGKPTFATVATSGDYDDLTDKPSIPAAQVNADWNASGTVAEILNKPTIPTNTVSSTQIEHIVVLTQAEYDALTPDEGTLYIIVAGD